MSNTAKFEFYRPTFAEFVEMPDGAGKRHVAQGGLLFREILPSKQDILYKKHRADGLCVLPFDLHFRPIDGLCTNKGTIEKTLNDGVADFTIKICLEHSVAYATFALINQLDEQRRAKKNRHFFGSASRRNRPPEKSMPAFIPDPNVPKGAMIPVNSVQRFNERGECRNCLIENGKVLKYCNECLADFREKTRGEKG